VRAKRTTILAGCWMIRCKNPPLWRCDIVYCRSCFQYT